MMRRNNKNRMKMCYANMRRDNKNPSVRRSSSLSAAILIANKRMISAADSRAHTGGVTRNSFMCRPDNAVKSSILYGIFWWTWPRMEASLLGVFV